MDRIQIQLPPELRKDIQIIADMNEWSFAETMRRAAEKLRDARAACLQTSRESWQLPKPSAMGFKPKTFEAYQAIVDQDRDDL